MAPRKLILICQYGGKFVPKRDGSLSYTGGEAHAVDVNPETRFDDLKLEIVDMWNIDMKTISIKYLLPSNKRTLITLSNDKDLQRMIDFHGDSVTADVYVVEKESVPQAKPKMPINRESRMLVTYSDNNIAASPAAATAPVAASATQTFDGGPLETAPDVNTTVIADSSTAISTAGTSIPARALAATTARSSVVAADASAPTTSPCIVKVAADPAPTNDVIIDDVRKRRRTASWKIGAKGFTIVSVADDPGQQVCTGTKEENINSPNTASSGDDPGEQIPSESSEHDTDSNPTVSVTDDFGKGQQKLMDSWKNGITNVGQEFKNVHEFRDVLRKYAIANHFVYQLKKNDTDRVSAKCKADGCSWRIHASWVPAARSFRVKKYFKSHTCEDISGFAHHPQATKHWLATLVKEMLQDSPHYKPKEGLSEKVLELFENAQHGYCIHHLLENFKKSRKGPFYGDGKGSLAANFLFAAHALRVDEFRKFTENVKTVSPISYDWIMNSEPQFWANSQFTGEPYNHISLDVVRSFKDWIAEVRELPIVQKIDAIRCKMMELVNTRRVDSSKYASKLTPCKEEKLQEELKKARTLKVLFSSDSMFEVHDGFINVVNMNQQECSCRRWKITGLPCSHAIAVFNSTGRSAYDYCSRYFTTEAFQLTYSESINPLPEIEKPVNSEPSEKVLVHPPRTQLRCPKRKRAKLQEVAKRPLHCSKCKGEGHNKASCKTTE
ncbi:Phox/Bem1p [Macleaya cordata]|uniref:Phox/Bem1p n=1 Tax=Macleaya cordata TaxID=56857 RepID=A0A200Q5W6_MACCD|nr:Phox/Bem1p [Macleaya cordata]